MKAMRLLAINRLAIEDREVPSPGPGEVLLRVEACGLCGSDRHFLRGEAPTALPVTLGHEFAGIVEAVGSGVSRLKPGMRVTGDPNIVCGHCEMCRAGRPNLCVNLTAIGVTRDGGFAHYLVMPETQGYEVPLDVPPAHAAFGEPISCCIHAIDVARIQPGQSVVILGGGVIGLIMLQLARLAGAGKIVLSTRQAPRRALAEKLGAHATIDPRSADAVAALRRVLPGGADVVLECAGVAETVAHAPAMARRGGTVVIFGLMPAQEAVPMIPFEILFNELRIEGAFLNPDTHGRAAQMIRDRALDLASLITRTIPLADLPGILEAPPAFGEIKVIVEPAA